MIKKVNEHFYEIPTAGLDGKMYFSPGNSCGKIKFGIGLDIEPLRGGWVIPLGEAWQMVIVSTIVAVEQSAQRALSGLRKNWRSFWKRQSR